MFKIIKALTQPGTLIFLALIALLIGFGLQLAVTSGVLAVAVLNAAAPVLVAIFFALMIAAPIAALVWATHYFYHDYGKEKQLDAELKKILQSLYGDSLIKNKDTEEIACELDEKIAISDDIAQIDKSVDAKLKRDYNVNAFTELTQEKCAEILAQKFSYRKAFLNACRDWFIEHKQALIIAGVLLTLLSIALIVFMSLFFAGIPVPFFIGVIINGLVAFFEAGFVGLGWAATVTFATHHLVAMICAGLVFSLGPVNVLSTLKRFASLLYEEAADMRKFIENKFAEMPNHIEDTPTSTSVDVVKNNSVEQQPKNEFPVVFEEDKTKLSQNENQQLDNSGGEKFVKSLQ